MLRKTASILFILLPLLLLICVFYISANDPPISPATIANSGTVSTALTAR